MRSNGETVETLLTKPEHLGFNIGTIGVTGSLITYIVSGYLEDENGDTTDFYHLGSYNPDTGEDIILIDGPTFNSDWDHIAFGDKRLFKNHTGDGTEETSDSPYELWVTDGRIPVNTWDLSVDAAPDYHGTGQITITLEDAGLDNDLSTEGDNATTAETFTVTVTPVNDLPTIDPIDDISIDEDAPEQTLTLTGISAGGGEAQPLRVTATSDNNDLFADLTVVYTSADAAGELKFIPVANQSGTATITVTVEDSGLDGDLQDTDDNLTYSQAFDVSVAPENTSHNYTKPTDVNNDDHTTPLDALFLINYLNANGSQELTADREEGQPYYDVDKDQWLTPSDAIRVINQLNQRTYMASLIVSAFDLDGSPITNVQTDQLFYLTLNTQDVRPDALGVFAAYADIYYDPLMVGIVGNATHSTPFVNQPRIDLSTAGLINEWGGTAGISETGSRQLEVARVPMRATNAGVLIFGIDAADNLPSHDVLMYGTNQRVDHTDIYFQALILNAFEGDDAAAEGEHWSPDDEFIEIMSSDSGRDIDSIDHFFGQY